MLRELSGLLCIVSTFAFEFWVGCQDLTTTGNVQLWVNATWADGFSVGFPAIYNVSDMQQIAKNGLRLLPGIHASIEIMQRQLEDHGSVADSLFNAAYVQELSDYANATAGAEKPWMWWAVCEDDSSGVGFSYDQLSVVPSSAADAWAQFDLGLQRTMVLANALPVAVGVPRVAQVGFGENAHVYFSRGIDIALIERANDDIGDLSTAIAFARGAARQYGPTKAWGVDLSWWWGVISGGVNNLPCSVHKRHALIAYFAGAAAINIEGGDGLVDGSGETPTRLGVCMQVWLGRVACPSYLPRLLSTCVYPPHAYGTLCFAILPRTLVAPPPPSHTGFRCIHQSAPARPQDAAGGSGRRALRLWRQPTSRNCAGSCSRKRCKGA
jgi:hypothetical protein